MYHPDRNKGGSKENEQKFREITAAYEVLGNVRARKLYDKGFISHQQPNQKSPRDPLHKFYKSRDIRNRPPPPGGKAPVYDFDEWTKVHYAEIFQRKKEMKERHAFHARMEEDIHARNSERTIVLVLLTLACLPLAIKKLFDYDSPLQQKKLLAEKEYWEKQKD
ncbi:dnaJ homolog subfamily C member 30, mitochondrial-like isoform X2 [Rhynchophorus ferrugineus]